jgi:hypothetical protein
LLAIISRRSTGDVEGGLEPGWGAAIFRTIIIGYDIKATRAVA